MKLGLHFMVVASWLMTWAVGTAAAAEPDAVSPLVSYQYLDSLAEPPNQPNIVSPVVSYQYFEWPSGGNVTSHSSPLVSFLFEEVAIANPSLKPSPTTAAAVVLAFSVPTDFGECYVLEFKNDLTDAVWSLLRSFVGDGRLKTFLEEIRRDILSKFIRVRKCGDTGKFLSFPLRQRNPYTARINAVFDHSMCCRFCSNHVVISYTDERGDAANGSQFEVRLMCAESKIKNDLSSFRNANGSGFSLRNQYDGGGTPSFLAYDGHPGYDYRTKDQAPFDGKVEVVAAAPGTVVRASKDFGTVVIEHESGYQTVYLHLSEFFFDGQFHAISDFSGLLNKVVNRGDVIGKSGGTGSGGALDVFLPHLHFEVQRKINGVYLPVDPYGWEGPGDDPYTSLTGIVNVKLWLE